MRNGKSSLTGLVPKPTKAAASTHTHIRVVSTIGVKEALIAITPYFERLTGHVLVTTFGLASELSDQIIAGQFCDVAILTATIADKLVKDKKIVAESRRDVARSGLGLAVRTGAAKPDIRNADALKRTLLAATSIATSKYGLAGIYFMQLLDELGIADAITPKIKFEFGSGYAAEITSRGEAELAVQLVSEILPVNGVELVGQFPAEVQKFGILTAGISENARQPAAALELIEYLVGPESAAAFLVKGLQPCG